MLTNVLVYSGYGENGARVFGYVIGTSYTFEITNIVPNSFGPNAFSPVAGGFVFGGTDTATGNDSLVFSDGGTETVVLANDTNGNPVKNPHDFGVFGSDTVFTAQTTSVPASTNLNTPALMITNGDGNSSPLVPFAVIDYQIVGNSVYAIADNFDVYKIGTDRTSTLVFNHDAGSKPVTPQYLFEFNGAAYFRAGSTNTSVIPNDFYRIDPVSGATSELHIGEDNSGADDIRFFASGVGAGQFYFWQPLGAGGLELFVSNGTSAGTHLVKDIRPGTSSSFVSTAYTVNPATAGDKLFFEANDGGPNGVQLWTSDGTDAGTFALTGSGTPVGQLTFAFEFLPITVGNQVFFVASRSDVGRELFVTDGTLDGTHLVSDIRAGTGSSSPGNFYTDGQSLYFEIASGPDDDAVWISDGTAAGTHVLSDPYPGGSNFNPPGLITTLQLDDSKLPPRTITGTDGDDNLVGDFLNETILGLGGNDTLDGRGGTDNLQGGLGNDTYVLADGTDTVIDTGGIDTITSTISRSLANYPDIENLTLLGVAIKNGTGNALNNTIIGNPNNNLLNGGVGADTLIGGRGNDTFIVDNLHDIVIEAANEGMDRIDARVGYRLAAGQSIETLAAASTSPTKSLNLTGNELAQTILGNDGNNILDGGAGKDVLEGFGGADSFQFSTALNATTNVDRIVDFSVADDTVRLDHRVFSTLPVGVLSAADFHIGTTAADASDQIIYNPSTGSLIYDSNGNAPGGATRFAIVAPNLSLTNADFIVY